MPDSKDLLHQSIINISSELNSDIFLINSEMSNHIADDFIHMIIKKSRSEEGLKENCTLFITTYGGLADAAYRIARMIDRNYKNLHLIVSSFCKSAGTLLALRSNTIAMGNFAEFGPLDVQLFKDDELSRTSGLSYFQSISSIVDKSFEAFEKNFLMLKKKSGNIITSKLAADISSKLSIGLFSPISSQLEPLKLGEVQRAIDIAEKYGKKLVKNGCGKPELVDKLINNYPEHGFIIDIEESKELFGDSVRELNIDETILVEKMFSLMRAQEQEGHILLDLTNIVKSDKNISKTNDTNGNGKQKGGTKAKAKTSRARRSKK